jgi:carbamoyltransferase
MPSSKTIRDRLNGIKGREWFRPVAPVVPSEYLDTYFTSNGQSPWMQFVYNVKEEYYSSLEGCTHVDGSARVQSVTEKENPRLYKLLEEYGNLTGCPILINTSFNIKGEPIVETPDDAITTFLKSDIDILVLGDFVIEKSSHPRMP